MKEQKTNENNSILSQQAEAAAIAAPPMDSGRQPYVAPAIEVIEVRTEAGYALSGIPLPWDPIPW